MAITITGFSETDKVPGFVGETKFGAGPISAASIPLILLLVGLMSSSGSMTADTDVLDVQTEDQANTYAGPGSELARMAYVALKYSGLKIKIACPTAAGGAVAASATITIGGSWTATGQWAYRIGGETITGGIAATDSTSDIAADIAAAIQGKIKMPVSAVAVGAVVTATVKSAGIRGNQHIVFQDISNLPSGMTSTLAGGSSVTGGGKRFASGAGTEDVTALLSTLNPGRYHRIAVAQIDSTNLALWRAQLDAKAEPTVGRMEHAVFATTGTLSAMASLCQTTLNEERFQGPWCLNCETHPSEIAASMASLRCTKEQNQPNSSYDGDVLRGVAPQSQRADWATRSTLQAALDEGVTPLVTNEDGTVSVVRAITTHSLNGSDPDYRTLDVSEAVVPDYVRDYDKLVWTTLYKPANPYVRPEPAEGEPEAPQGVATPSRWNAQLAKNGFDLERALILTQTALNPPVTEYDEDAKRLMSIHPAIPLPHNHQTGVSVRQGNPA